MPSMTRTLGALSLVGSCRNPQVRRVHAVLLPPRGKFVVGAGRIYGMVPDRVACPLSQVRRGVALLESRQSSYSVSGLLMRDPRASLSGRNREALSELVDGWWNGGATAMTVLADLRDRSE